MHFILWLTLLFLPHSISQGIILGGAATSSNTFTLVQKTTIATCNGSTSCSVSVSSTGSGHLGVLTVTNLQGGVADYVTAVSGGGTWVVPSGCQAFSTAGAVSCAYTLSTTSGVTSLTLTLSDTSTYKVVFWEYSFTLGSCSLDTDNSAVNSSASTSAPGVTLTLSGSNDVLLQFLEGNNTTPSAVSTYGNFQSGGQSGFADLENSSSGTAPTWTLPMSATSVAGAIAFK